MASVQSLLSLPGERTTGQSVRTQNGERATDALNPPPHTTSALPTDRPAGRRPCHLSLPARVRLCLPVCVSVCVCGSGQERGVCSALNVPRVYSMGREDGELGSIL